VHMRMWICFGSTLFFMFLRRFARRLARQHELFLAPR
jgi:hypothetical protein